MKKIGREVFFISAKEGNARNGEGDFIRLKNNDIMFAYTEYVGNSDHDHATAQITAIFSKDEGETWSDKKVIITPEEDDVNIMCVSFLRMLNGDLGIFYSRKYINSKNNICTQILLRRSSDEGKTWSNAMPCLDKEGYFVFENARVIMLKNGRIIIPLNLAESIGTDKYEPGHIHYYISDDDGKSFYDSGNHIPHPFNERPYGLLETGIIEFEDGKIFSFSRTTNGSQFESFSEDGGINWTVPKPSTVFFSPSAIMHIRHLNEKHTAAIFNPIPNYPGRQQKGREWSRRTPLVALICEGDGSEFWNNEKTKMYALEDDDRNGFSYPAILPGKDYFLCSYYHSNNSLNCLNSCKILKINFSELE